MRILLFVLLLTFAGCAHRAPKPILLPTAAAVRAPIVEAKASNARAVQLAAKAKEKGMQANSAEAQELSAVTLATDGRLTDALAQVDKLTAQLLTAQKQVDRQTSKLAWYVAKYNELLKKLSWYRWHFLYPLIAAVVVLVLAVGVWVSARFTSWGARTFGPYILGAQKLAAIVAAPEAAPIIAAA